MSAIQDLDRPGIYGLIEVPTLINQMLIEVAGPMIRSILPFSLLNSGLYVNPRG